MVNENCWSFMKCGADKRNDCPAYPKYGQECWFVAGTKCKSVTQGIFAKEYGTCNQCPWFKRMEREASDSASQKEIVPAKNCWEFWNCGKDKPGDCPAFPREGEHCWLVAGTDCTEETKGVFAKVFSGKRKSCHDCPWYLSLTDRLLAATNKGPNRSS